MFTTLVTFTLAFKLLTVPPKTNLIFKNLKQERKIERIIPKQERKRNIRMRFDTCV
jgi:hypothetical protein